MVVFIVSERIPTSPGIILLYNRTIRITEALPASSCFSEVAGGGGGVGVGVVVVSVMGAVFSLAVGFVAGFVLAKKRQETSREMLAR